MRSAWCGREIEKTEMKEKIESRERERERQTCVGRREKKKNKIRI